MKIDIDITSSNKTKENINAVIEQITAFITDEMRLSVVKIKKYKDREKLHTFIIADEV